MLIHKYWLFLFILIGFNSCNIPEIHFREYLRPIRKLFNKERSYWTDRITYKGDSGTEMIYYKNGRPALERFFDENGLLKTVTYLGRNGEPIRFDSLAYAGDELIAGYYYAEPGHDLILRFLSYKQQDQLSQRSWFGGNSELLSREFFLFDRKGRRHRKMVFDSNDSLVYSETFRQGTDELDIQNTYALDGRLVHQIRYSKQDPPYEYVFDKTGRITKISQLHADGNKAWTNDLFYNHEGIIERSNFSTNGRFLFTYLGDLEFFPQTMHTWKHPYEPGNTDRSYKYTHRDPFLPSKSINQMGHLIQEYRLPSSRALFKKTLLDTLGRALSDTLFANQGELIPASVISFDTSGNVSSEVTYDLEGNPQWNHTWFRDNQGKTIREELTAFPDTFAAAITRFYDIFDAPAFSERFSSPDSFDGTWVFYNGGGEKKTLFYNYQNELTESWLFRPSGDTIRHSHFKTIDYFRIEKKLGHLDTLLSQRRFTEDGILNWELIFNKKGQLTQEVHRKKDGSIYRDVIYDPEKLIIKSNTFSPVDIDDIPPGDELRGEISSQIITRLNATGETVQIISNNSSGGTDWEKRYAYRGGRLMKSAQLGADGKPVIISSYTYNNLGQVLTESALHKDGDLIHSVEYKYDDNHDLIWKMFSSSITGTVSSNRYYYDDSGRLTRNEVIEAKRFIEAIEYEYYPDYYLRIATHYNPEGDVLRKEIENYFGGNVFAINQIVDEEGIE